MRIKFFILLLLASVHLYGASFTGRVVGVIDGDTITVLYNHTPLKVRLAEIDAPEKKQNGGMDAKYFLSSLIFSKVVNVDWKEKDKYGRIIGFITVPFMQCLESDAIMVSVIGNSDLVDVNLTMVASGYAWEYKGYSKNPYMKSWEENARDCGIGIWKNGNPVYPAKWRKKKNK